MKRTFLILITLFIICLTGCKSSKSVTGSGSESDVATEALMMELTDLYKPWDTYSVSGKMTLSGQNAFSSSIQVKMVKDKCITISIRPVLGLEVAKVYADNDSAVIINKLNKVYTTKGLDVFSHVVPMNIGALQDIFLSRVFSLNDGTLSKENIKKFSATAEGEFVLITTRKKQKDFSYVFAVNNNRQLETLSIIPAGSNKKYIAQFGGYETSLSSEASTIAIATEINEESLGLRFDLNVSKAKWNSSVDNSISIGKSYKKVTLKEFFKILKSF